jgi:hypothetical protein
MDNDSPERERSTPHVTVEIAYSTEPGYAARPAGCTHRVTWRDMNPAARYFTLKIAVLAIGAVCVASARHPGKIRP